MIRIRVAPGTVPPNAVQRLRLRARLARCTTAYDRVEVELAARDPQELARSLDEIEQLVLDRRSRPPH